MLSSTLNLSDLDGSNGFVINSPSNAAYSSSSLTISSAGDINGDGFTDLFVRLDNTSDGDYEFPETSTTTTSAYVVFGGLNVGASGSIDLSSLDGNNGFRLNGTYYSYPYYFQSGLSVTTASDLNNDGIADLIIGASSANPNDIYDAGSTYILFGGTNIGAGGSIDPSTLDGSNGFTINGTTQPDYFSNSVTTTSDIALRIYIRTCL
jgi:hypothetical protein